VTGSDQPRPVMAPNGHTDSGAHLTGWQPIETAPMDGAEVLAGKLERGAVMWPLRSRFDGAWTARFGEEDWRSYDPQPTHWMPLPPAPEGT
jgi:hypothetical protein